MALAEDEPAIARPGADQVQRLLGPAAVEGPTHGLAVDCHHLTVDGCSIRVRPGREAGLEGVRVDQHKDAPEGVVGRDAVGQGEKGLQPRQLVAAVQRNLVPALGTGDHRAHGDDQDVEQVMLDLACTARIFDAGKMLDQRLD